MDYVKVGKVSILKSEIETKSLEELKVLFPNIRTHILEEIYYSVHKRPIKKESKEK